MGNLFLILFFSSFVSEDLTCISAGILANENKLSLLFAILFTGIGIFIGDLGLYGVGYYFKSIFQKWNPIQRYENSLTNHSIFKKWQDHFVWSIFVSRFLPGTRLPLYLLSGYFRMPFLIFTSISFLAVSLWTSAFVSFVFLYGKWVSKYFTHQSFVLWAILVGLSFYFCYQSILILIFPEKRKKLGLFLLKYSKLEFWPSVLFYLPLVPYLIYLSLRHRGIRYLTTTNPGIFASGIAGESKSEILALIPKPFVAKYLLLKKQEGSKDKKVQIWMKQNQLRFPIIAKPDIGERGLLVHKILNQNELSNLFQSYPMDWLLQEYVKGPFEVGVFYFRRPQEKSGQLFSITEKVFPKLTGDGIATIETLLRNHPRYRFQFETHKRHNHFQLQRIIPNGETVSIGSIGNHIQGCLFQDGEFYRTKNLERKIVKIGDATKGFYFGRFDIRFSNQKDFLNGNNFKIIELNGVTSESTNLYDPKFSILQSYSILYKQWKLIYEIGVANFRNGQNLTPYRTLFQLLSDHKKYRRTFTLTEKNL
ncbi:DedA family protein [Leptospira jelokensis]|uniref:DedA family protein n=1 Tax=Leptospira jelokensis TaxID=2484931 RepID=UPI001090D302|nr:DedA family protein [Leptospira jelokensis]TGM03869.1 SNARE-like domain protein [Leptospira jelokensis]